MTNHTTGAQRHNARQDKIWETAKQLAKTKADTAMERIAAWDETIEGKAFREANDPRKAILRGEKT